MTNTQSRPTRHPAALLMQIRVLHTYVGLLIAPAVLFFACTGILQLYSLHEAHGAYTPPPLIEKLGSLHKDQVFALGHHGAPPRAASHAPKPAAPPPGGEAHHAKLATTLLKAVFAAVAVGLVGSTSAGIWMALLQPGRRRLYLLLLLIGAGVPLVLAALGA
jgi:hypothetical protein